MKKTLAMLLALVMLFSLCACSGSQTADPSNPGSVAEHRWNPATCTTPKTCSICGATEGTTLEHSYQNGTCTGCGDLETITHSFETGTGYALSLSTDGTEINCYQISCEELFFTGYSTEKPAEGYYAFREYNGTSYYSPAPSWGWLPISAYTISDRTVRLDLYEETLELELISANQYKVTKGVESLPAGIVFTFGADMCSFMGHCSDVKCEGNVTCMYCSQIVCEGFGHEYGKDGVCFRCYAAMRPSDSSSGE